MHATHSAPRDDDRQAGEQPKGRAAGAPRSRLRCLLRAAALGGRKRYRRGRESVAAPARDHDRAPRSSHLFARCARSATSFSSRGGVYGSTRFVPKPRLHRADRLTLDEPAGAPVGDERRGRSRSYAESVPSRPLPPIACPLDASALGHREDEFRAPFANALKHRAIKRALRASSSSRPDRHPRTTCT